jgi:hypothetical protein
MMERAVPESETVSSATIPIESGVSLVSLEVVSAPGGQPGALLTWATRPGPEDLSGYRLEKEASGGAWLPVVTVGSVSTYLDTKGELGDRYRLFAINGLGGEQMIGETVFLPATLLAAWPLPFAGGALNISFMAAAGSENGATRTAVAVYDGSGRLVRRIAEGDFSSGAHLVSWDGRDEANRRVRPGIYFLKHRSGDFRDTLKLVIVR